MEVSHQPSRHDDENDYIVPVSPKHVLKIALRVKKLIDTVIPIEFEEDLVTKADSVVLNEKIYQLLLQAAGGKGDGSPGTSARKYQAVLVFALLICKRWYIKCSTNILSDSTLYDLRSTTAEYLAKKVIERQEDEYYLFRNVLCQRYSITLHGKDSAPVNALELAVDQHATIVISSSGYQRCMKWLWRGWIVQSEQDPSRYVMYNRISDTRFSIHFDPDRIKTPKYQNYLQLMFSCAYLIIYSFAINDVADMKKRSYVQLFEWILYVFTAGYLVDEIIKIYDVGLAILGFWNVFNDTLYILVAIAAGLRIFGNYYETAFHILACCAPLVWGRLLLYLDSVRFFGAMLVVLKELLKESLIFFVLLAIIACGFLQAFIGLDEIDGVLDVTQQVLSLMTRTVLDSPEFGFFEDKLGVSGIVLYYVFGFLVSTLLLNILVALFNSAYEKIYDNANDEYMALVAHKTLRYVRAPDEHVFVPPLNLLEVLFLSLPLKWWIDRRTFNKINDWFLTVIYSPILLIIAIDESRTARRVLYNRSKGVQDDANEQDEEWDLFDGYDSETENEDGYVDENQQMEAVIAQGDPEFAIDEKKWAQKVHEAAPRVDEAQDKFGVGWEDYNLVERVDYLTRLVEKLLAERAGSVEMRRDDTLAATDATATATGSSSSGADSDK